MHSNVSSDWLPSYIMATRPVLEIFKMAGKFPDRPRTWVLDFKKKERLAKICSEDLGDQHPLLDEVTVLLTTMGPASRITFDTQGGKGPYQCETHFSSKICGLQEVTTVTQPIHY